ncbi:MAG: phosphomannomutase/phosphoglucomutase [Calditerrivibrio sp.]|nr:phosphomannomutase/phosphoglucomutase [Calditerrivibrio sp.]
MVSKEIFRQYDIRGVVPTQFNSDVARKIGNVLARKIKSNKEGESFITVGRDVRLSSDEIFSGVVQGITDTGCNVIDLHICPTPVAYFSSFKLNSDGFIMITGSHNPPEYNGLKFGIGKDTIHSEGILSIMDSVLNGDYNIADEKGVIKRYDILVDYIDFYMETFAPLMDKMERVKKIKVVIDAGNGTASLVAPKIFKELGVEVIELYCQPDGRFPNHHPDPTVEENLVDVRKAVLEHNADFAVAFDGDADRIGVLDEKGDIIWGDMLLYVYAKELKKRYVKPTVIADVKSSKLLFDSLQRMEIDAIMWKTGHSLIKDKLKKTGAELAGEMSGHIFFKDRFFGFDDAIYAAVRFLEAYVDNLLEGNIKVCSDLVAGLPKVYNTPEIRLDCDDDKKFAVVEKMSDIFKEYKDKGLYGIQSIITIDGIRVNFENGWGLLRASNTQPVLVMRFEAESMEDMNRYRSIFTNELNRISVEVNNG